MGQVDGAAGGGAAGEAGGEGVLLPCASCSQPAFASPASCQSCQIPTVRAPPVCLRPASLSLLKATHPAVTGPEEKGWGQCGQRAPDP